MTLLCFNDASPHPNLPPAGEGEKSSPSFGESRKRGRRRMTQESHFVMRGPEKTVNRFLQHLAGKIRQP
jgi:hypothetical protein